MKSTRCWLPLSLLLLGLAGQFGQAFDYENSQQQQQFGNNADEQGQAVQNSWPSDDLGYGDQDGYELPLQPNYYDQQLDQEADDPNQMQQYSDYIDELQNLQSLMEQGYGANQDYDSSLSRNNGPDYSALSDYNMDYNGLDYPAASSSSSSSTSGQETYPSPPNPCPKGENNKSKNNDCIPDMPDTAEFSQMYQAINKNGEGSKMNADMLNSFFQTV